MPQHLDVAKPPNVILLTAAVAISTHVLALALPLALLQTYDRILPNQAYSTTFVLAAWVTVTILLEALLRYGRSVLFARIGEMFETQATLQTVGHVMRADGKSLQATGVPSLSESLKAVAQIRDFWSGSTAATLYELPFAVIYIGLIAYIGGWLAIVPTVLTLIALLVVLALARSARRATGDFEATQSAQRNFAWGIFGGLFEAKAMAAEPMLARQYRDLAAGTMSVGRHLDNQMAAVRESGALLSQLSTIGVVTFGAFMVVGDQLTTGGLAACTLLAGRSIGPTIAALSYLSQLGRRDEAQERINAVLAIPQAPLWRGKHGVRNFSGGDVGISGNALRTGPVTIPRGSIVQIDAANPAVATAALEAIAQLDDTLDLDVTFDGQPAAAFTSQSLKQGIAMASARTSLVAGTLLDNLTLFAPQYDADALLLAKALGLSAFIDGLRQGLMTEVGPAGAEIVTPGIGVRIGLIRALVRRPALLCLDEVGGTLDLDGMRRLIEALKTVTVSGQMTIFMVSRDPALLQIANARIAVSGEGRPA